MGSESTVIRGNDATQLLSAVSVRVGTITDVMARYVTVNAVDHAYQGVVYSGVDFVMVPGAGHPVHIPFPCEAQRFFHC